MEFIVALLEHLSGMSRIKVHLAKRYGIGSETSISL
jgi:hypothetical protein